jgi:hypothetical protein
MYHKPEVERFGTMRDLTRAGFKDASDGMTVLGISGNNCELVTQNPDRTYNYLSCRVSGG